MVDGRIKYVIDAYTTADTYPYGRQSIDASSMTPPPGPCSTTCATASRRSSTPTTAPSRCYLTDTLYGGKKDPIIGAWAGRSPTQLRPTSPSRAQPALPLPGLMFQVQTEAWVDHTSRTPRRSSTTAPLGIAQQPPNSASTALSPRTRRPVRRPPTCPASSRTTDDAADARCPAEFLLTRPFVLSSNDEAGRNLTSVMTPPTTPDFLRTAPARS